MCLSLLPAHTTHTTAEVARSITDLLGIARALHKHRFEEEGSIKIGVPKLTIVLSPDGSGAPVGVCQCPIRESNELIENMTALTNHCVDLRIARFLPYTALLRRHPHPQSKKLFAEFREFCARALHLMSV